MNQAFDPFNLLLLAIAVVVFFKLRSVLGTRTGREKTIDFPPLERKKPASANGGDNVIPIPGAEDEPRRGLPPEKAPPVWEGVAKEGEPLALVLEQIREKEPAFTVSHFLEGAGAAYEIIVTAFAAGDKKALRPLLTREVFQGFSSAIDERRARGETLNLTFVGLDDARIVKGEMKGKKALLTVKFVSEVITSLVNGKGEIIEGDPERITRVTDIWTFERPVPSRDPNWKLAATEAHG